MKSHEIYKLVHEFDKMWKDERLNLKLKVDVAQEMLASLPPLKLLKNCNATYTAVTELISQTVNGAINASNAETTRSHQPKNGKDASAATATTGVDGRKYAPSPNKTNEDGGRTKVGKTSRTSTGTKKRTTSRSN